MSNILIIGVSGMLGNAVFRLLSSSSSLHVLGAARSASFLRFIEPHLHSKITLGIDVENPDSLSRLFAATQPDVVINCVGLVKQLADASDPLAAIPINALLPHRLARLCEISGARLIHMSTDCVFSGSKGNYLENDSADAEDLYGRSKYLGEVDYPHTMTLRTSIIGHELNSAHGLINWFLAQSESTKGYTKAFFTGLPTVELATIIRDFVLPKPEMSGVYHVSSASISKYDLLNLVAKIYGKTIKIVPDEKLVIDRSLNSSRFRKESGYVPPAWEILIKKMHDFDKTTIYTH